MAVGILKPLGFVVIGVKASGRRNSTLLSKAAASSQWASGSGWAGEKTKKSNGRRINCHEFFSPRQESAFSTLSFIQKAKIYFI